MILENKKVHPYMQNLEKFQGEIVEVKDMFGEIIRGICLAIYKQHLNIIVETEDSIIVVKNPQSIRRSKIDDKSTRK